MNHNRNSKNRSAGFTLVEVLVAIIILGTTIGGVFYLVTQSIRTANLLKSNVIAAQLVQEGVEVARNLRDRDWLSGQSFGSFGRSEPVANGSIWQVQWNSTSLTAYDDKYINTDETTGIFSYDTGSPTVFKRSILISDGFDALKERVAVVTVSWTERNINRTISAEIHLYNWK